MAECADKAPSLVLGVVLQTGDELSHVFALEADLVDCSKHRKPVEEKIKLDSVCRAFV